MAETLREKMANGSSATPMARSRLAASLRTILVSRAAMLLTSSRTLMASFQRSRLLPMRLARKWKGITTRMEYGNEIMTQ